MPLILRDTNYAGGTNKNDTLTYSELDGNFVYLDEKIDNNTNTNTGSLLVTASVNNNTITFTKGDTSTFNITVDTGSIDLSAGPGITVNGLQITASVRSVNGIFPTNGNIQAALTATKTGTSASLVSSGSGAVTASLADGLVWIISGDPTPSNNGDVYIYSSGSVGVWYPVSPLDTAASDARYVKLDGDNTPMTGHLDMGGFDINNVGTMFGTASFATSASWAPGGSPGGLDTEIQFNGGGAFSSSVSFRYKYANQSLEQGEFTQANGLYSHAEGYGTKTGLQAYSASIVNGVVTISQYYGDISYNFNPQDNLYIYDVNFLGRSTRIISQSYYDNVNFNTVLELFDTFLNISKAYVGNLTQTVFYGDDTIPSNYSHAEGYGTQTGNNYSHAEGQNTFAIGGTSHSEGFQTKAVGEISHAEGMQTEARGYTSHAEGELTTAIGTAAHSEGNSTTAVNDYSHTEGVATTTIGFASHAEGYQTIAIGSYSHAEGTGSRSEGEYSHAEGDRTRAFQNYSHAEGSRTFANGLYSHAEGQQTSTSGQASHTEGYGTRATGPWSHAEGENTVASFNAAHAEGAYVSASGYASHAEGHYTRAAAWFSHAEGSFTTAIGLYSHAEGSGSVAIGTGSHAAGGFTVALGNYQSVVGQFNISSSAQSAFIIGNGTSNANRNNLLFASGSQIQVTGSVDIMGNQTISDVLTLPYQNPLPSNKATGSIAVSGSGATFNGLYLYNGTSWIKLSV